MSEAEKKLVTQVYEVEFNDDDEAVLFAAKLRFIMRKLRLSENEALCLVFDTGLKMMMKEVEEEKRRKIEAQQ